LVGLKQHKKHKEADISIGDGKIKPCGQHDNAHAKVDEPVYGLPDIPFVSRVHKPQIYDEDICRNGTDAVNQENIEGYVFLHYQAYVSVYQFRPAVSPHKVQQGGEDADTSLNTQRDEGESDSSFTNAGLIVGHQGKCRGHGDSGYIQADIDQIGGALFHGYSDAKNPYSRVKGDKQKAQVQFKPVLALICGIDAYIQGQKAQKI
jgi:hypothetical protein